MQGSFLIKDVLVIIVFSLYYNFLAKSRKLFSLAFLRSYASSGSSANYDWFF